MENDSKEGGGSEENAQTSGSQASLVQSESPGDNSSSGAGSKAYIREPSVRDTASSRPTTARSENALSSADVYVAKDGTRIPCRWRDRYTQRPRTSLSFRTANDDEIQDIMDRLAKPTISWTGGASLRSKQFVYVTPAVTKMNPYPRLKRMARYEQMNDRRLPDEQVETIVSRLYSKHTTAWKARVSPNPHSRNTMTTY